MYQKIIEKLERGEDVELHPKGNSMTPLIKSGQRIVLSPVRREIKVGDIVLAKVKGHYYIHLVSAAQPSGPWQISNNHGHVNGWARHIYGVVTSVG